MVIQGRTNNPHGRPRIGRDVRVRLNVSVDPKTLRILRHEADRRMTSMGILVDEAVNATIRPTT